MKKFSSFLKENWFWNVDVHNDIHQNMKEDSNISESIVITAHNLDNTKARFHTHAKDDNELNTKIKQLHHFVRHEKKPMYWKAVYPNGSSRFGRLHPNGEKSHEGEIQFENVKFKQLRQVTNEAIDFEARKLHHKAIQTKIKDLTNYAKAKGVDLMADHHEYLNDIHLAWIENHGKRGAGSDVINKLHNIADEHNVKTYAVPIEGDEHLVNYYKRRGYEHTGEDTEDGPLMVRHPRGDENLMENAGLSIAARHKTTGKLIIGKPGMMHMDLTPDTPDFEDHDYGYVTNDTHQFLSREEAMKYAKKNKPIMTQKYQSNNFKGKRLMSHMLKGQGRGEVHEDYNVTDQPMYRADPKATEPAEHNDDFYIQDMPPIPSYSSFLRKYNIKSESLSESREDRIAALHRLINHPATPEHERNAAKAALGRVQGSQKPQERLRGLINHPPHDPSSLPHHEVLIRHGFKPIGSTGWVHSYHRRNPFEYAYVDAKDKSDIHWHHNGTYGSSPEELNNHLTTRKVR